MLLKRENVVNPLINANMLMDKDNFESQSVKAEKNKERKNQDHLNIKGNLNNQVKIPVDIIIC